MYGSIASSYFEISNTIVANNITVRARWNIWLASRCLKGIQCITDGFAYQPKQVYQIKENRKLPGLQTLSYYKKIENHFSIQKKSLGNRNWKPLFQKEVTFEKYPNLDQLAKQHIETFWNHYQIKIPYEIEQKKENTSLFLFTIKKAHYAMKTLNGETFYKFGGISGPTTMNETNDQSLPIYYKISNHILNGEEFTIETLEERTKAISKLSDFIESKKTNQIIYPGESIIKKTTFQLTNDDFLIKDEKSLKKRDMMDYSVYLLERKNPKWMFEKRIEDEKKRRK